MRHEEGLGRHGEIPDRPTPKPKKRTQRDRVYDLLADGRFHTREETRRMSPPISDVRSRLSELKRRGHYLERRTRDRKTPTGDNLDWRIRDADESIVRLLDALLGLGIVPDRDVTLSESESGESLILTAPDGARLVCRDSEDYSQVMVDAPSKVEGYRVLTSTIIVTPDQKTEAQSLDAAGRYRFARSIFDEYVESWIPRLGEGEGR